MEAKANPSTALVRKRTDTELMPPPPPAKKIKRPKTVVDEETYTDGLSKIIARDFFPGLLESETQQEYLDALSSQDPVWISSASRRLKQVMTPGRRKNTGSTPLPQAGQTPRGYIGDTPASTAASVATEIPELDTNLSLGAFQAKYTSEDNESFYQLLDKQNQKKAEKYAWLWAGNRLLSKMEVKQKQIEAQVGASRSLVDDGFKKDKMAIKDRDDRPAAPDSRPMAPRNALMFAPGGLDESVETVAERAQAESRAGPKTIIYANTRIPNPNPPAIETSRPGSPTLSAIRDAIAGRPRVADQDSVVKGDETPRVNGYAFVDDEDSEPDEEVAVEPIIDLGPGDATPNPFKIQQPSKREGVHRRMVERIAESKRASTKMGLTGRPDNTPSLRYPSSPQVSGNLTPAAQRLWSKIGTSGSSKSPSSTPFNNTKSTPARRIPGLKPTPR